MLSGQHVAGTKYTCYATILFADNTTKTLSEADFELGNNGFVDGAGASSFPLGVAVERSLSIEIQNDGSYDNKTFVGAAITFYAKYGNNTLALGKFTVLEPETYGETIIISAVDDMFKANKKYSTNLTFPVTLQALFNDACSSCGITNGSPAFNNGAFQVDGIEEGKHTFREIFGYIAMLAGGNARIDVNGSMRIMSYDLDTPTQTLTDFKTLKTDYNDITITGLKAVIGEGQDAETYSFGNEGYMLELSNPIFTAENVNDALEDIAVFVVNKSFRKFEGDHVSYPFAEFMDCVYIKDRKGNQYTTVITDVDFTFFGFTTLKNSAESALRNANYYVSDSVKTLISTQKAVQRETTAREAAIAQLQQALANASGMYSTDVTQPDQSVIRYLHDKPTLSESTNILKITNEAIAISNNGGTTYSYGVTFNGDFIANILSASGVNADWINTGALVVRNNDTTVFQADCDTGSVSINGSAGNVRFTNCPFISAYSKTFLANDYTTSDVTTLQNLILGTSDPTTDDYRKYDFNLDGVLDIFDFARLRNMIGHGGLTRRGDLTSAFYVSIPGNDPDNLFRVYYYEKYADGTTGTDEIFKVSSEGAKFAPPSWSLVKRATVSGVTRVNYITGGYKKLGHKVEVQMIVDISATFSISNPAVILTAFPAPTHAVALSVARTNTPGTNKPVLNGYVSTNGWFYISGTEQIEQGTQLAINGTYWISGGDINELQ